MGSLIRNPAGPDSPVLVLIIALLVASGCTDTGNPAPVVPVYPTISSAAPADPVLKNTMTLPPATPACAYPPLNPWTWVPESYVRPATVTFPPEPGSRISKADLFGTPSLKWEEYRTDLIVDSTRSNGTWRIEFMDHDYEGNPAIRENFTSTIHIEGTEPAFKDTIMDDMYYDADGNLISVHRRYIRDGQFLENGEIPVPGKTRGSPDCPGNVFAPRFAYIGIDPVTVPAGSYPGAMKFVETVTGSSIAGGTETGTYWFVTGVPVPVKRTYEARGVFQMVELTGWG
jgi:hypothetical protein